MTHRHIALPVRPAWLCKRCLPSRPFCLSDVTAQKRIEKHEKNNRKKVAKSLHKSRRKSTNTNHNSNLQMVTKWMFEKCFFIEMSQVLLLLKECCCLTRLSLTRSALPPSLYVQKRNEIRRKCSAAPHTQPPPTFQPATKGRNAEPTTLTDLSWWDVEKTNIQERKKDRKRRRRSKKKKKRDRKAGARCRFLCSNERSCRVQ